MTKKTILFDLDGTLTDSGEGIINCAAMVLAHYNLPVPSREEMGVFIGPPLHEIFVEFGVPADQAMEAVMVYRSRYNTVGKYENIPYPGIPEMLQRLKDAGHRLFIATSKPQATTEDILHHFDLAKYFHLVCGASEDTSRATKEAVIAWLLEQCPRDGDTVMVGDTHYDVLGAAQHGIPTIGVSWGYGEISKMKQAGASAIVNTVEELEMLLTK